MRAPRLLHLAALGAGVLALTGCPEESTPTPGELDTSVSTVSVSRAKGVRADGVDKSVIEVRLLDRDKNPVKGKDVQLVATGGGNTLVQPASATNDYGVAIGSIASAEAEIKTISAKVGSLTLDSQPTVEFVHSVKPAAKLAFTVQPTAATVGASLSPAVAVSLLDDSGTVTPLASTVTLRLGDNPGSATLGGAISAAAVDGVAIFSNLTLSKVGKGYTLVASSEGLTDVASQRFDINPRAAAALVLSGLPASVTSDVAAAFSVAAVDHFGNTVSDYSGQVSFSTGVTGDALPPQSTLVNGEGDFQATFCISGDRTLRVSDGTISGSATTTVTAGTNRKLVFTTQPAGTTAGADITFTVTVEDAAGNTDTSFTGPVAIAKASGPGPLEGTATREAVGGVAQFVGEDDLHFEVAGAYTLTASAAGMTSATSDEFTVAAGSAHHLAFTVQPTDTTAGSTLIVEVTAQDALNNKVTTFADEVTIAKDDTSTGAGALQPTAAVAKAAQNGVVSLGLDQGLHFDTVGSYRLSATATGLTAATSDLFLVALGTNTRLVFLVLPQTTTAGQRIDLEVRAEDEHGNPDTSFAGEVSLAKVSGPGPLLGTLKATAVDGIATFGETEDLHVDLAGHYTLQASANGPDAGISNELEIIPGVPHHLAFTPQPADAALNAALAFVVTAQDALNNTATDFAGDVTIAKAFVSIGSGELLPSATVTKVAYEGVASFSDADNLHFEVAGYYVLSATATDLGTATSNTFKIGDNAPYGLLMSGFSVASAGVASTVTLVAVDIHGQPVEGYTGTVHFSSSDSGAILPTDAAFLASDLGSKQFGGVIFTQATPTAWLKVEQADNPKISGLLDPIQVLPGAAKALEFQTQPTSTVVFEPMAPVAVKIVDDYGNLQASATALVKLSLEANPTGAILGGTIEVAAASGVASFDTLALDKVGAGYRLLAQATDLAPAVSAAFSIAECDDASDCDDGDACTDESCEAGACSYSDVVCDLGDACNWELCDHALGCIPESKICMDLDRCTVDSCDPASGCQYPRIDCLSDACTNRWCDPVQGSCESQAVPCGPANGCVTTWCDVSAGGCQSSFCGGSPTAICYKDSCCEVSCGAKVCGDDGCGGSCGTCEDGFDCVSGACVCASGTHLEGGTCVANVTMGWCNLQSPGSFSAEKNVSTTIYGQIWSDGLTSQVGRLPGVEAQICYGPEPLPDPVDLDALTCVPATFNVDYGNNDEYMADLAFSTAGTYRYVYAFRGDGVSWNLCLYDPKDGTPLVPGTATITCTPACADKVCGDDGCGGSCGTCPAE